MLSHSSIICSRFCFDCVFVPTCSFFLFKFGFVERGASWDRGWRGDRRRCASETVRKRAAKTSSTPRNLLTTGPPLELLVRPVQWPRQISSTRLAFARLANAKKITRSKKSVHARINRSSIPFHRLRFSSVGIFCNFGRLTGS